MRQFQKEWIYNATYQELLSKWRFEPSESGYFADKELYEYYCKEMNDKKKLVDHVQASKNVGW